MVKISNKKLLEIAQNESTPPEQLSKIWATSKSIKVKKAVASNPNADAFTLRLAARLYLEEVLENPAFELLKLFNDDEWVQKIGKIYEDPSKWRAGLHGPAVSPEIFARAALISPQLSEPLVLRGIMEGIAVRELTRAFKYPKTREKSRKMMLDHASCLSMEAFFKAYNSGLLNEKELLQCFKYQKATVGLNSCRKSTYTRTIKSLLKKYKNQPKEVGPTISAILLVSRATCINWIKQLLDKSHLPIVVFSILNAKKHLIKTDKIKSSTFYSLEENIKAISSIVTGLLWHSLDFEEKIKNLRKFYEDICQLGLEAHEWGNSNYTGWPVTLTNELCEGLQNESIQIKSFYVKSGCFGKWFRLHRFSAKFAILEEVNQWLYEQRGIENILYDRVHISNGSTIVRIFPHCWN